MTPFLAARLTKTQQNRIRIVGAADSSGQIGAVSSLSGYTISGRVQTSELRRTRFGDGGTADKTQVFVYLFYNAGLSFLCCL